MVWRWWCGTSGCPNVIHWTSGSVDRSLMRVCYVDAKCLLPLWVLMHQNHVTSQLSFFDQINRLPLSKSLTISPLLNCVALLCNLFPIFQLFELDLALLQYQFYQCFMQRKNCILIPTHYSLFIYKDCISSFWPQHCTGSSCWVASSRSLLNSFHSCCFPGCNIFLWIPFLLDI